MLTVLCIGKVTDKNGDTYMFTAKQKEVSVDLIVLSACSSFFFRLFVKPPKTVYENDEHYKKTGKVLSTYLWKGFVTGFVKNHHVVR
jgi:hypothetical protein